MDYEQTGKITKHIIVQGIIQGVGFRPLVFCLAQKHNICGTVRNNGGIVEIHAEARSQELDAFIDELCHPESGTYEIVKLQIQDARYAGHTEFQIVPSGEEVHLSVLTPDLPVCESCQHELHEKKNRRYHHPFISCAACGPRYTIMERLPYDRENTSMEPYEMCADCQEEYIAPTDRRFHAQTISCHECGPSLIFGKHTGEQALKEAVNILKRGGIIAVKGIGGYHYACTPFAEETVLRLRQLKGREEKPFAVMFGNLEQVRDYCIVSTREEELLLSKARPIVLLEAKASDIAPSVGKGSLHCGAFLPYTAIQILLISQCGPLIMTSANLASQPIIREDARILEITDPALEGVLYHTRQILRQVDDSVAKIIGDDVQMIRRSRGYVPLPVFLPVQSDKVILAMGGDLKAAFCLCHEDHAVMSQYFGDLEEQTILKEFRESITDLCRLLQQSPEVIVSDLHPGYHSARLAKGMGLPVTYVQHHHAHIASVMAEHGLDGPVIGVALDGTGYGTDGKVWGGEFLVCEGSSFARKAHLGYMPMIGGDQSMKDAKKTATCYLLAHGLEEYIEDERAALLRPALSQGINMIQTSSMGRLFDCVASLLGIAHENRYEGYCAILLEQEAALAVKSGKEAVSMSFAIEEAAVGEDESLQIRLDGLLKTICEAKNRRDKGAIALGFHRAVADMIGEVCVRIQREIPTRTVALSGGVFQNSLLTRMTVTELRARGFDVYMNRQVPPNDGCISLGQTYIEIMR